MLVQLARVDQIDLPLPTYQHVGDSGADLYSHSAGMILPTETKVYSTGLKVVYITDGYEIQVRSRSGLSIRGIVVANSPGTIDNGYRGDICVILHNQGHSYHFVSRGDRIAQLVVVPVYQARFEEGEAVIATSRNANGFGSSGR